MVSAAIYRISTGGFLMLPLEYRKSNQCCCYGSRPFFDPDPTFHIDAAPDLDLAEKSYGI
jgi:hypothetical protein